MVHRNQFGIAVVLAVAGLCASACPTHALNPQTNQNSDPGASTQSSQNSSGGAQGTGSASGSSHSKARQNPADDNPFPVQQSEAAAAGSQSSQSGSGPGASAGSGQGAASAPDQAKQNSASQSKSAGNQKQNPAEDNPFPEDQSATAAKSNGNQNGNSSANQPQSGRASSNSSTSGYSSSNADLPPPDLGQGSLGHHPKMDTYTRDQTQDGRIKDDLNTADFYMKNGNYRGAFMRYDDALQYDPQNDVALFGKAMAMCKQNLTSDAMAHFKSYAENNPQGKYALKAEKMLAHPNKCKHNF